jgi:NADH dehydrogenase
MFGAGLDAAEVLFEVAQGEKWSAEMRGFRRAADSCKMEKKDGQEELR